MTYLILIKALMSGVAVAIATSIIGVFILWKRMAYFGDAISHSSLFGLAIASVIAVMPIYGIMVSAVVFCFLIFLLERQQIYSPDTVIGIVTSCLLALAMILLNAFPSNIELEEYLFGDLIKVSYLEIGFIYFIAVLVAICIYFWFEKLLLATINPDLARIAGINVKNLELKFLLLTAIVIASLIKIIGIFLITSMIILPAAIARNFSNSPKSMVLFAIASSLFVMIFGLLFALLFSLPSAPVIICFAALLLVFSILCRAKIVNN